MAGANKVKKMQKTGFRFCKFLAKLPIFMVSFLLKTYQITISPFLQANCCRFTPSCSQYAFEAINKFGFFKGGWLAIKRLASCQPFSKKSGFDPLPKDFYKKTTLKN